MAKCVKRFLLLGVLPLVLLGGVVAWFEWDLIQRWHCLRQLERARGEQVQPWAERTAGLEAQALPGLLALLTRADEPVCHNAGAALRCLGERWGPSDPRLADLLQQAVQGFGRLSPSGRQVVLALATQWATSGTGCPEALAGASARLLADARSHPCPDLHAAAVELALVLLERSRQADLLCTAREVTRVALTSPQASTRARALRLATQPGIDLHKVSVPLLKDADPLVRRAAMLAVGEKEELIATDVLMGWLHDPDAEVRRLCEAAMRGPQRGSLPPEFIRLARLITDPSWEVRVSVLDHLDRTEGLDLGVWLRRLSHDEAAPVRAAALRFAVEHDPPIDLADRLTEIARSDPDSTVSSQARYLLGQVRP